MSFQKHYYRDCVEEWIEQFNKDCSDNEILVRNILSRAYYTIFLHCQKAVEEEIKRRQASFSHKIMDHRSVIDAVADEAVKTILIELKQYRERADYNTEKLILKENTSVRKIKLSKSYIQKELLAKIDFVFQCIK